MDDVMSRLMQRTHVQVDGCWVWQGTQAGAGYGFMSVGGKRHYVHRLSYELAIGLIPEGLEIDHLCRNRLCLNPEHLEPVTHAENRRRARATHCVRGHLLAEGREYPGHGRICRKCDAIRRANYRKELAAA